MLTLLVAGVFLASPASAAGTMLLGPDSGPAGSSFTATVTFPASNVRYVRVEITANTGWPAGQLSELEVYAS